MALEDEFKITVEEENTGNITTLQEAVDFVQKFAIGPSMVNACCVN